MFVFDRIDHRDQFKHISEHFCGIQIIIHELIKLIHQFDNFRIQLFIHSRL